MINSRRTDLASLLSGVNLAKPINHIEANLGRLVLDTILDSLSRFAVGENDALNISIQTDTKNKPNLAVLFLFKVPGKSFEFVASLIKSDQGSYSCSCVTPHQFRYSDENLDTVLSKLAEKAFLSVFESELVKMAINAETNKLNIK